VNQNPTTRAVTHMEPDEITAFQLYRSQAVKGGLSRDRLPYTGQFDKLLADFNRAAGQQKTYREFWTLLDITLKAGEPHIEDYLTTRGLPFEPKT
jgi:hypothetical protein